MTSRLPKKQPFGFIVLCPERNLGGLKNTVNSIKRGYENASVICTIANDANKDEIKEASNLCDVYKGGSTITSLINTGMKKTKENWNIIVFAGSWITPQLRRKFDLFVKDEKDILFPVMWRKTNFIEGSMNGLIIHKKAFKEVGDFPNGPMQKAGVPEMELIKMFWALDAIKLGYVFKAIVGMKVC